MLSINKNPHLGVPIPNMAVLRKLRSYLEAQFAGHDREGTPLPSMRWRIRLIAGVRQSAVRVSSPCGRRCRPEVYTLRTSFSGPSGVRGTEGPGVP